MSPAEAIQLRRLRSTGSGRAQAGWRLIRPSPGGADRAADCSAGRRERSIGGPVGTALGGKLGSLAASALAGPAPPAPAPAPPAPPGAARAARAARRLSACPRGTTASCAGRPARCPPPPRTERRAGAPS